MAHINPGTDTTINPLQCETCGHYKEGKYADTCKNIPFPDHMDSAERQYIKDWIEGHGCASHTSAEPAQERIDAAIKELERLAKEEDEKKREPRLCNEAWMGHTYANSAYLKAIALLQAGDPK